MKVTAAAIDKKVLDLTAVVMKCFIFWGITPCSPQTIRGIFRLHLSGLKEKPSNNLVVKQVASSARSYIPEGRIVQAGT
jgi:hypothetical protein